MFVILDVSSFFTNCNFSEKFLLSFSLFLRNEVDQQIEMNRFDLLRQNGNFTLCLDKSQDCYFLGEKANETSQIVCNQTMTDPTPICPKHLLLLGNSSRIMQKSLGVFLFTFFLNELLIFWYQLL